MDKSYVYKCLWRVVDAVNANIRVEFPLHDPVKLALLEREFRANSRRGVWAGQVALPLRPPPYRYHLPDPGRKGIGI